MSLSTRSLERRFSEIVADIEFVQMHTVGLSSAMLANNQLILYAVERALGRISEAATRLKGQGETLAPEQPWAQIRALGNRIRHEYDHLDSVVLWEIVETDLPSLKSSCERVLAQLQQGQPAKKS